MQTRDEVLKQRREYWNKNKERLNKERKEWYEKNKQYARERNKKWHMDNKEHFNEWQRKYYSDPERKEKKRKSNLRTYYKYHEKYRLKQRKQSKKKRQEEKITIINHYSKGKNCCELCGITNIIVLTIDHINGGGNIHRKETGNAHIAHWLIKKNFPEGFRILCFNCQNIEKERKNQYNPPNRINF